MKIGSNKDINKDHKSMTSPEPGKTQAAKTDKPIKDRLATMSAKEQDPSQNEQVQETDNQRMLTEKHNDEKLAITILIVGAGLVAYHFW